MDKELIDEAIKVLNQAKSRTIDINTNTGKIYFNTEEKVYIISDKYPSSSKKVGNPSLIINLTNHSEFFRSNCIENYELTIGEENIMVNTIIQFVFNKSNLIIKLIGFK